LSGHLPDYARLEFHLFEKSSGYYEAPEFHHSATSMKLIDSQIGTMGHIADDDRIA
jgi:hypothetical protein